MLNHVVLMGRLTRDPEIRNTKNDRTIASFSLAVDRSYKNASGERETDFFDIIAWQQRADFVAKYFKKGQLICVEGRLQRDDWTDKSDHRRTSYRIVAESFHFAEGRKSPDGTAPPSHDTDEDDDGLPF